MGSRVSEENFVEAVVMIKFRWQLQRRLTSKLSSDGWNTCSLVPRVLNVDEP